MMLLISNYQCDLLFNPYHCHACDDGDDDDSRRHRA